MREMKQTATFAASRPVIALTAACWGSVFVAIWFSWRTASRRAEIVVRRGT